MKRAVERVVFICNPVFTYGKTGWTPDDTFLSGTEESIREWATEIKKRGFDTAVYYNGEPMDYKGVAYRDYADYVPGDIDINVKHLDFVHKAPKTWYLTNEFDIASKDTSSFDGVIFPSKWAVDNLGYEGVFKIVPHGFDRESIYPGRKINKQCLYSSSPDRGLYELLEMWPYILAKHPDATLLVTYSGDNLPDVDNVMYLGQVDEATMNELYQTSDVWAYPCNGGELFCMTGIKAQVAGLVPVYYPTTALHETVREGARCNPDNFVSQMCDILGNKSRKKWIREHIAAEHYADWQDSTKILLDSIGAYK